MERAPECSTSTTDPFQIRDGFVPEDELAGLRRRKKGKFVAQYQSQQNTVRIPVFSRMVHLKTGILLAHPRSVETHGRTYGRCKSG